MLLELNIKDFAIIDSLHLRLNRQFNVFTGETGAGKSIIIDAVNALLGGKIGAEFVRAGCDRATVEGIFSIDALPPVVVEGIEVLTPVGADTPANLLEAIEEAESRRKQRAADTESADAQVALASLLHEFDIDPEDGQLILSRDIFRSGRTVARINGRALSQHVLQQVASWLVDIHGQSEHMTLLRPEQHINFLDRYAELLPLRDQLNSKVAEWRNARKTLQSLQQNERDQERRAEFLRFEIEEIDKAELRVGEIEELEEERKVLSNAERLRELCSLIYEALQGSDLGDSGYSPALDLLRGAQRDLGELSRLDSSMDELNESLAEAIYQLEDVATSVSSYQSDIEDNPSRLIEIEERLDLIAKLKRKYGASIEEILQRASDDRAELDTIVNRDEMIQKLQQQDSVFRKAIGEIADTLSRRRQEAATHLATAMEEQLNDLNMRRARFQVEILQVPDENGIPSTVNGEPLQHYACDNTGIDHVQFLIAPNPGEPFKPLTKIASGGETSRLMLALKTILAGADATPTLIFDEIDSGISGRSGQVVGEKLWQLTLNHQVICITHLPQIAAFADTHYNVNKQIIDNRTMTIVNELRPEQRIREISHIMGGNVTEFSLKSAEEMLARSDLWKENWKRNLRQSRHNHNQANHTNHYNQPIV
ncbi:DNA repair protein RecN [Ktedonobacter racemifer]|uniref:DNA repair protein RecN n=1 Tax=Ktedonobacter racemifer DSM 44963 TaxID=485913 RepID=D6TJK4_KTERA|nr:DNA repair protein RecN [Ktedonobacter racemifer]EFH89611.1 DNA repair protein RecN [Ktedonobacter racemifer DSM 44963]